MPSEIRLALDRASVRRIDQDGHLHVEVANISKAGVNDYLGSELNAVEPSLRLEPNRIYRMLRSPEELAKAAPTFEGKPLLDLHKPQHASTHDHDITVGAVSGVRFDAPFLKAELHIWEAAAIAAIQSGQQRELSCGYRFKPDMTPGEYEGKPYDGRLTNIVGNHVAIVEDGRAGPDVVIGDASPAPRISEGKTMKLSHKGVLAMGALRPLIAPKLAQDAKPADLTKALRLAFDGVSAAGLKGRIPAVKDALAAGLKGKLASDDDMPGILDDVQDLLDELTAAVDDVAAQTDPTDAQAVDDDGDCASRVKAIMKAANIGDDVIDQVIAAMKPEVDAAMDEPPATPGTPEVGGGMVPEKGKVAVVAATHKADPKDLMAMDSKAVTALVASAVKKAENDTIARMNAIAEARELVRPHVGELRVAMDSAEAVLKFALDANGIDTAGVPPEAFAAMVKMLPKPSAAQPARASMAMDAASVSGFASRYPDAAPLRTL